jgi:hypothetical protein
MAAILLRSLCFRVREGERVNCNRVLDGALER